MGKKAPSPPPAPDPIATAKAQTESNVQTATANSYMGNANEYSPFGTVTYDQYGTKRVGDNDVPLFNRNVTLSPEQQALYNNETAIGLKAGDLGQQQIDKLGGILNSTVNAAPDLAQLRDYLPADMEGQRRQVEAAQFERINPSMMQERDALENKLVNQGLVRGTDAFRNAMSEADRSENDARLAITAQGGSEMDRVFSQALQSAQFDNTAAQQGYTNYLQSRATPINEVSSLLGMGQVQVPQAPQYQAGQVAGTPVGQYVYDSYKGNLQGWQAQQQMQAQNNSMFGSMLGGLFGLGARISDRRLKRDIRRLGVKLPSGLDLYAYRYRGGGAVQVGVMADEVRDVVPAAVIRLPSGFDAVDYGMVL